MQTVTAMLLPALLLVMLTVAQARSLKPTQPPSPSAHPPANSHLMFYLTVEKELMPQTKNLAARARDLLQIKCREFYNGTSQCMLEAEKLPEIAALGDLPSEGALNREGSKVFSKHLLKDVYRTLLKLQMLLEEENEGIEPLTQLIAYMNSARRELRDQMNTFYRARLRERDSYKNVGKSKKRYMRQTRLGHDCSHDDDDNDDNDNGEGQDCMTEDDFRLRLLYSAYRQLLRVHHVLGYTVRLSWLAVEDHTWRL